MIQRLHNAECYPLRIQVYVLDHGGETILSTEFQIFLQDHGIYILAIRSKAPNYNAIVERNIQTKKAMVRGLHLQSQLSGGYWPLTSSAA